MRSALVCGAGGFIGNHLVKRLKREGFWVRGVDLKRPEFAETVADDFVVGDLRDPSLYRSLLDRPVQQVYQLAADMGGAGYLFTGDNDAAVMHNSALINLNVVHFSQAHGVERVFYSSSACVYPAYNQADPDNPKCTEDSVYPADPDSEYGWEKLFSERLYLSFARNSSLRVRIARFHNIFGPEGTWDGGKEKAPAAICRKVALAQDGGEIEVWGDGRQTRSFLFVDECLEGVRRLIESNWEGPVNIGSEEMISVQDLARLVIEISGKSLQIVNVPGPVGVRGRNSNNRLIAEKLGWAPSRALRKGLEVTYRWIEEQVRQWVGAHP